MLSTSHDFNALYCFWGTDYILHTGTQERRDLSQISIHPLLLRLGQLNIYTQWNWQHLACGVIILFALSLFCNPRLSTFHHSSSLWCRLFTETLWIGRCLLHAGKTSSIWYNLWMLLRTWPGSTANAGSNPGWDKANKRRRMSAIARRCFSKPTDVVLKPRASLS